MRLNQPNESSSMKSYLRARQLKGITDMALSRSARHFESTGYSTATGKNKDEDLVSTGGDKKDDEITRSVQFASESKVSKETQPHVLDKNDPTVMVLQEKRMSTLETVPVIFKPTAKNILNYVDGIAPKLLSDNSHPFLQIIDGTLRAFGQVVFCNNPLTGFFILTGFFVASWRVATCSLLCSLMTNIFASVLGVESGLIVHGLLGYNAVLVGSGIASFLSFDAFPNYLMYASVVIASGVIMIIHLSVARVLATFGSAALTFPFNITMMCIMLGVNDMKYAVHSTSSLQDDDQFMPLKAIFKGISEIFILDSVPAGVLIFLGMLISSRILAIACAVGSFMGAALSLAFFKTEIASINLGLAGYNSALTLPAIFFFLVPSLSSIPLGFLGVCVTLVVQSMLSSIFSSWSLPIMTLPFCLATLPFLLVDTDAVCIGEKPSVNIIALTDLTTPEEHFTRFGDVKIYCMDPYKEAKSEHHKIFYELNDGKVTEKFSYNS